MTATEGQQPEIEDAERLGYEWASASCTNEQTRHDLGEWPTSRRYLNVWTPMNWMSGYAYAQTFGESLAGARLWALGVDRFVQERQAEGMERDRQKRA